MPVRNIVALAAAIFLGLIAVLMVRSYLGSQRQAALLAADAAGTTPVVVASQSVARGVALQPNLLKVVRYPKGAVPPGAFQTTNQLSEGPNGARLALRSIAANEPVLAGKISGPDNRLNMSGTLTSGKRAVSLRSDDVIGVGGFVLPGDRVDILLTRDTGSNNTVTQVLAENVRVLGVDQSNDDQADTPVVAKAVTVEVSPEEAQAISLAQAVGRVSLSLRYMADHQPLARRATTISDLGFGPPALIRTSAVTPRARRPISNAGTVRVTRGIETTGYQVAVR